MEEQIIRWVTAHGLILFVAYFLFMLAVQALPRPDEKSPKWYLFVYGFVQVLAANVGLVRKALKIGSGPEIVNPAPVKVDEAVK